MSTKAEVIRALETSFQMTSRAKRITLTPGMLMIKTMAIAQINASHVHYHAAVGIAKDACEELMKEIRKVRKE